MAERSDRMPARQAVPGYPVQDERDIDSPRLRELWRYWQARHRAGRMPTRADIDPTEIGPLLPYVMLVDAVEGGEDFRFRLVGTHVAWIHGRDNTGRLVSEAFPAPDYEHVMLLYRHTVESRMPRGHKGEPRRQDGRPLQYEIVHLPLAGPGGEVATVLAGLEFSDFAPESRSRRRRLGAGA